VPFNVGSMFSPPSLIVCRNFVSVYVNVAYIICCALYIEPSSSTTANNTLFVISYSDGKV
jgi:hypothetical protein